MKKNIIVLVIASILLTTCAKDVYNPDICFTENVLPIFVSNCSMTGCHNSITHKKGYDLTNYDGIMKGVKSKFPLFSKVYTTVRGNNPSMPTGSYPKLSAKDVTTIKIWIEMGAPNSSNCKNCDTLNFTYSSRVKTTIQTWCIGCHSAANSSGGYDLTSYEGVVNSIANNKLMGSIRHSSGYSPMPKNATQLQECDINAIEKWINGGHPNN